MHRVHMNIMQRKRHRNAHENRAHTPSNHMPLLMLGNDLPHNNSRKNGPTPIKDPKHFLGKFHHVLIVYGMEGDHRSPRRELLVTLPLFLLVAMAVPVVGAAGATHSQAHGIAPQICLRIFRRPVFCKGAFLAAALFAHLRSDDAACFGFDGWGWWWGKKMR